MSNAHNMKIYFKIFIQYWFVVINVDTFFKIVDQTMQSLILSKNYMYSILG
jgi:hypothetical protein